MKVSSTESRKRALQGEFVEVAHKGRLVARLIARDTITGTLADLDQAQDELDSQMRSSWEQKWASNGRVSQVIG